MNIPKLGIENKGATVILGAGASRGASCFELPNCTDRPPLDTDFFSLLQRVQHKNDNLDRLATFVREEYRSGPMPRLEEFFTLIESLNIFYGTTKLTSGRKVKRYREQLEAFVSNIACFFSGIFLDGNDHRKCIYHEQLVRSLKPGDGVISFNYDCLMDFALAQKGSSKWNPLQGYGVPVSGHLEDWGGNHLRDKQTTTKSIRLLKLHGSLNWDRSSAGGTIALRKNPYEEDTRHKTEIVPPVWNKRVLVDSEDAGGMPTDKELTSVWRDARRILRRGKVLIAIGYSVPPTDLLSQALLRVSARERTARQTLSHVIVANPDRPSRHRFIDLIYGGVSAKTKFIELEDFRELYVLLGGPPPKNHPPGSDSTSATGAPPDSRTNQT